MGLETAVAGEVVEVQAPVVDSEDLRRQKRWRWLQREVVISRNSKILDR